MNDAKSNVQSIDEKKIVEEREIDIFDIWWRLLEQWRGIVTIGLIFASLLPTLKYGRDMKVYNKKLAMERAAQADLEAGEELSGEELAGMTDAQDIENMSDVMSGFPALKTLTYYKAWDTIREYYTNSVVMKINASREKKIIMMFYVSPESEQTDCFMTANMYTYLLYSDDFATAVAKMLGEDISAQAMKEMILANLLVPNRGMTDEKGVGFTISVVMPHDVDTDKLSKKILKYMNGQHDIIEKQLGKHKLQYLNYSLSTVSEQTLLKQQYDIHNQMVNLDTNFQKAYVSLSEDQKILVDRIINSGEIEDVLRKARSGEDLKKMGFKVEETKKPSPNVRFAVVGFVFGAIVYAAIYLMGLLLFRRIRDEREVARRTGLRSFGGIYEYPYKKGLQRFLHSKKVYRLRHKGAGNPFSDAAKIARMITAKAEHFKYDAVSLITLGETSDWAEGIMNRQRGMLEKNGLDVRVIPAADGGYSIDDEILNTMAPACMVLLSGETTPHMAAELLARLREYNIPVLGTEFLEGR